MTSKEYEQRRRAIEEQCQADLELIRAGCQAKLRALERVWLQSSGDGGEPPRPVPGETVPGKTVLSGTVLSETVPRETPDGGA